MELYIYAIASVNLATGLDKTSFLNHFDTSVVQVFIAFEHLENLQVYQVLTVSF